MAKSENVLMTQKVNVTPELIQHWRYCMNEETKHLINKYLLRIDDCDVTTFKIKNRTFVLIGMVNGGNCILREDSKEGLIYWECSASLVQHKLGRLKSKWSIIGGEEKAINVKYTDAELHLKSVHRRKKAIVIDDEFDDNLEISDDEDIVHVNIDDIDENEFIYE